MSTLTLTPTTMREAVWIGVVDQSGHGVPQITATHHGEDVPNIELRETDEENRQRELRFPIPASAIAEGLLTFVISDTFDGEVLGHFSLMAGEAFGEDLRAEVDLLRAELDMLKRAFRRHCVETS